MVKRKPTREKGKIRFSEYFKKLEEGEKVGIKKELSIASGFPSRLQGRTGIIEGKRGKAYIVKIKDLKKEKRYIIPAIHLKKLK